VTGARRLQFSLATKFFVAGPTKELRIGRLTVAGAANVEKVVEALKVGLRPGMGAVGLNLAASPTAGAGGKNSPPAPVSTFRCVVVCRCSHVPVVIGLLRTAGRSSRSQALTRYPLLL
jgi:hypothetical protein